VNNPDDTRHNGCALLSHTLGLLRCITEHPAVYIHSFLPVAFILPSLSLSFSRPLLIFTSGTRSIGRPFWHLLAVTFVPSPSHHNFSFITKPYFCVGLQRRLPVKTTNQLAGCNSICPPFEFQALSRSAIALRLGADSER
jgi:hypothetical protein